MNPQRPGPDNGPKSADPDARHADAVLQHSRALRQDAHALAGELRGAVDEMRDKLDLKGRMERNPYGTLLVAAGVGYVLGGGLLTRFTGNVIKLGLRLMVMPMLKDELARFTETIGQGPAESEPLPDRTS
jgi:hypothetical protein